MAQSSINEKVTKAYDQDLSAAFFAAFGRTFAWCNAAKSPAIARRDACLFTARYRSDETCLAASG
jgi:hypothetical protein